MGKKHQKDAKDQRADAAGEEPAPKMKRKEYERELRKLDAELVAMQESVKASGTKVCIVFEGRDSVGKGGTIKAITGRVAPGSSASWPCPARPSGSGRRCTCSATSPTCPRAARS